MKLSSRKLAYRCEQRLETLVPKHIITVTHNNTHGVTIKAIIGHQIKEYAAGTSWTTCDMTCQKVAADYMAAMTGKAEWKEALGDE